MAEPLDLNKSLENLINSSAAAQTPNNYQQASYMQITKTGDPDVARMQQIFQQAFPDQTFEAITDENGQKGIRGTPKPRDTNLPIIPAGYSPKLADAGINDLKAALENAKTDEEKFQIANKLNTLVQTQRAYNYDQYKRRAETEFGVPEIERAIEQVRQAELRSPFNPGNGLPSKQRMDLIEQLGVARARAGSRIAEYMSTDATLAGAEALAKGTITGIEGKMQLEGRQQIIDERTRQKLARDAAVSSYDPNFINSVSVIKRGVGVFSPEDAISIGQQIYDRKISLSPFETTVATSSNEGLTAMYPMLRDTTQKNIVLNILKAREEQAIGDKKQAQDNIDAFRTISEKAINVNDPNLAPVYKNQLKQIQSEVTAQSALAGAKTKDELFAERMVALKRNILSDAIRADFQSNIAKKWDGLIKSDPTAQAIFKESKGPVNFRQFVDQYYNYNDGQKPDQKSRAIQAMIASAAESLPKSIVLPIPSAESFQQEAQRIMAESMLDKVGRRWGHAGFVIN